MTRELSGEKYVTLSKIIPMVNCLTLQIISFSSDLQAMLLVKDCFLKELKKRFGLIEQLSPVAIATILDPRFKNLHFQDPAACAKAMIKIRAALSDDPRDKADVTDSSVEQAGGTKEYDFWEHHKALATINRRNRHSLETSYYCI